MQSEIQQLKKKVKIYEDKLVQLGCQNFIDQQQQLQLNKKENRNESKLNTLFERDGEKKYALKLAYVGINYYGLEAQPGMPETIEYHIFNALEKLLLVKSREDCSYSRAGRTDRGVSAFGNVISLRLRDGENWLTNLNKILPDDIKILDICPVENSFNARYDCTKRIYKYFFFKENMDIERMREAAQHFLGEHDFRNFCKLDVVANQHFVRVMFKIEITKVEDDSQPGQHQIFNNDPRLQLYVATIEGNAFLWHQIRCMMQVLFHVGRGYDTPNVVLELFNLDDSLGKPQYELAPESQLVLYDCQYPEQKLFFKGNQPKSFLVHIYGSLKKKLQEEYIRTFFITTMSILALGQRRDEAMKASHDFDDEKSQKKVQSLLKRNRGPTPEELIGNLKGKRKGMYDIKMQKVKEYEQKSIKTQMKELPLENGTQEEYF